MKTKANTNPKLVMSVTTTVATVLAVTMLTGAAIGALVEGDLMVAAYAASMAVACFLLGLLTKTVVED